MRISRRRWLQAVAFGATSLVVTPTTTGCAAPAAAPVAAPVVTGLLASAGTYLGMKVLDGSVGYWVERGWDSVFSDGTEADPDSPIIKHAGTETCACSTKPVRNRERDVQVSLIKFWTPDQKAITFQPRALQALSRAAEALSADVGYPRAAEMLLPINSLAEDNGTPPGDDYRTVNYQARDGGTVQIAFDGTHETVQPLDYPAHRFSFPVDPANEFYLSDVQEA